MTGHRLRFALDPFLDPVASGVPDRLQEELLRMNRDLRLAKFGLSEAGAIVLTADLPLENLDPSEIRTVVRDLTACVEEHRARLGVYPSAR